MSSLQQNREEILALRRAAEACVASWISAQHSPEDAVHSKGPKCDRVDSNCQVLFVEDDGRFRVCEGSAYQLPSALSNGECRVKCVDRLNVGQRTAAAVQIEIATSKPPGKPSAAVGSNGSDVAGWLVFLFAENAWRCISAALSHGNDANVEPYSEFETLKEVVWGGYRQVNRDCDGAKMAQYFHETCRLTYVDAETGKVRILNSQEFCDMVRLRYSLEPHKHYVHLENDDRVAAKDELLSGQFATPLVAMVKLKVGHPPFLWTDFLTVSKLRNGRWWIVHKSSCSEPLLVDEKL